MLTKISQKILPDLSELKIIDADIDQGSGTETIILKTIISAKQYQKCWGNNNRYPRAIRLITRIDITPSPPPLGDKLLPGISQVSKRETIINDDDDITNYKWSRNYK